MTVAETEVGSGFEAMGAVGQERGGRQRGCERGTRGCSSGTKPVLIDSVDDVDGLVFGRVAGVVKAGFVMARNGSKYRDGEQGRVIGDGPGVYGRTQLDIVRLQMAKERKLVMGDAS